MFVVIEHKPRSSDSWAGDILMRILEITGGFPVPQDGCIS